MEASLLFGRGLGESGLTFLGDVGYRVRAENVPEDLLGWAGLAWEFLDDWVLTMHTFGAWTNPRTGLLAAWLGTSPTRAN